MEELIESFALFIIELAGVAGVSGKSLNKILDHDDPYILSMDP